MVSATACAPGLAVPSSTRDAARGASVWQREQTLLRASEFQRVLRAGRRTSRGGVTVVSAPGVSPLPRVGIVVSRRTGNAVRRNRAKRRLRHLLAEIPWEQNMDYVVIADRKVVDAPSADVAGWLADAVTGGR